MSATSVHRSAGDRDSCFIERESTRAVVCRGYKPVEPRCDRTEARTSRGHRQCCSPAPACCCQPGASCPKALRVRSDPRAGPPQPPLHLLAEAIVCCVVMRIGSSWSMRSGERTLRSCSHRSTTCRPHTREARWILLNQASAPVSRCGRLHCIGAFRPSHTRERALIACGPAANAVPFRCKQQLTSADRLQGVTPPTSP